MREKLAFDANSIQNIVTLFRDKLFYCIQYIIIASLFT